MAYRKEPITGKARRDPGNRRKFKINKDPGRPDEVDFDILIEEDGEYNVEGLNMTELPGEITNPDGSKTPITWFNNFWIKQNGQFIDKKYFVTIPDLQNKLGSSRLVIFYGTGNPEYFGPVSGDTIELKKGDPAIGRGP